MGLISTILTLPIAPLRGVVLVAEQVLHQAEDVYYDPAAIRRELQEVDRLHREGQIDDAEAMAWEDELIDRMMTASERTRHG